MQKQLFLLHKTFSDYVSGSQTEVEAILTEFNIQPKVPVDAK